jgi:hypothetical protein
MTMDLKLQNAGFSTHTIIDTTALTPAMRREFEANIVANMMVRERARTLRWLTLSTFTQDTSVLFVSVTTAIFDRN